MSNQGVGKKVLIHKEKTATEEGTVAKSPQMGI